MCTLSFHALYVCPKAIHGVCGAGRSSGGTSTKHLDGLKRTARRHHRPLHRRDGLPSHRQLDGPEPRSLRSGHVDVVLRVASLMAEPRYSQIPCLDITGSRSRCLRASPTWTKNLATYGASGPGRWRSCLTTSTLGHTEVGFISRWSHV